MLQQAHESHRGKHVHFRRHGGLFVGAPSVVGLRSSGMNGSRHNRPRKNPRAQQKEPFNQASSSQLISNIFIEKTARELCISGLWRIQKCARIPEQQRFLQRSHQCRDRHALRKKNALLEDERGAVTMTVLTNAEISFSQTSTTHNLLETQ